MEIRILQQLEGARAAEGLAVVIDVFRAFTVECYAADSGVGRILATGSLDTAYAYKKKDPACVLVGERGGAMCEGFECGNSPSDLVKLPLAGRTMVHTTSAGTQGLANAVNASEVLAGSLVNAAAIARYIRAAQPGVVSLVCMGLAGREPTDEDTLCAEYIRALLTGETIDLRGRAEQLKHTSGAKFFDPAQQYKFPQADFGMCVEADRFDFVLRAHREGDLFRMETVRI